MPIPLLYSQIANNAPGIRPPDAGTTSLTLFTVPSEYILRTNQYMGDTKSGQFIGKDLYGNKYFENNAEELPRAQLFHQPAETLKKKTGTLT